MIVLLRERATREQLAQMLEALEVYVKVAVDINRGVLAGGGPSTRTARPCSSMTAAPKTTSGALTGFLYRSRSGSRLSSTSGRDRIISR